MTQTHDRHILFDGDCGLCHNWIRFVLSCDKHKAFRFSSMQSSTGQLILQPYQKPMTNFDSIVYIENGQHYHKSQAILKIIAQLGYPVKILLIGWLVPGFIRDSIYDYIARHRYQWFGQCDDDCKSRINQPDRFV